MNAPITDAVDTPRTKATSMPTAIGSRRTSRTHLLVFSVMSEVILVDRVRLSTSREISGTPNRHTRAIGDGFTSPQTAPFRPPDATQQLESE